MGISTITQSLTNVANLSNASAAPGAPDLETHVTAIKNEANSILNSALKLVATSIGSSSAFANAVIQTSAHVQTANDDQKHSVAVAALRDLEKLGEVAISDAKAAQSEMSSASATFISDAGSITSDLGLMRARMDGDQATMKSLDAQIASVQAKINDYHSRDWMWAIPIAGWIERGIESLAAKMAGLNDQKNVLIPEVGTLRAEQAQIAEGMAAISPALDAVKLCCQAVSTFSDGVSTCSAIIETLGGDIGSAHPNFSVWINAQFLALEKNANNILSNSKALMG